MLFDFDGDLYGRTIEVALHHYLRPEAKFDSVEALKAQMDEDAEEARRLLAVTLNVQVLHPRRGTRLVLKFSMTGWFASRLPPR